MPAWSEPVEPGQLVEGGNGGAQAGREVDVGVAALDRGERVDGAGGKQLGPAGQGGAQGSPAAVDVGQLERGLGAGDVQDDQVVERFGLLEGRQVGRDAVDCLANRLMGPGRAPVGELRDGLAGPEMRSRDARVQWLRPDRPCRRRASLSRRPRMLAEFLGRFGEGSRSDVVAADHEIAGIGKRQACEHGQFGYEARAVGQAAAMAASPTVIAVPTPPKAPTNQRPTR